MMNFERGLDPKKSMDIGVKIYRCGYCGNFTTDGGVPLPFDSKEIKEAREIVNKYGISKTELVQEDCCIEKDSRFIRITHDMALDAGNPDLEGTFI
jgi:hypothetical protein